MAHNTTFNNYNKDKNHKAIKQSDINSLCKCINGHMFDYNKRIKYKGDELKYYAPCQGKCPICGTGTFSFLSECTGIYPIKFNYTL